MNTDEKALSRILFKNKIHEANGQKFEDIFTKIMNYAASDFQQIKPWGNIGDRKNDGYIKSKGIYYQVFAPEDIRKSYTDIINKIDEDFKGLKKQWSPVNEFYFVLNDKFLGVNPDSEQKLQKIKEQYGLKNAGFLTPKDLENTLFSLQDDQILTIAGHLPDPLKLKTLDYSILTEIINFIMQLPLQSIDDENITLPDWDEKIKFNNLSELTAKFLNNGYLLVGSLEKYLKNNGDFLTDDLKNKMRQLYITESNDKKGDDLFWSIVNHTSPKPEAQYQSPVIVIMAKYFETCDIFEEPEISRC